MGWRGWGAGRVFSSLTDFPVRVASATLVLDDRPQGPPTGKQCVLGRPFREPDVRPWPVRPAPPPGALHLAQGHQAAPGSKHFPLTVGKDVSGRVGLDPEISPQDKQGPWLTEQLPPQPAAGVWPNAAATGRAFREVLLGKEPADETSWEIETTTLSVPPEPMRETPGGSPHWRPELRAESPGLDRLSFPSVSNLKRLD